MIYSICGETSNNEHGPYNIGIVFKTVYYETFSRYFSPFCVIKILFLRYEQYRVDNLLKKKSIRKTKY